MRNTAISVWVLLVTSLLLPTKAKSQDEELYFLAEPVGVIENYRDFVDFEVKPAAKLTCSGAKIGFGATGSITTRSHHVSAGNEVLLHYPDEHTSGLLGQALFVAPCDGLYFFSISFIKDAYYYSATTDDVYVVIRQNGVYKGRAWSGEGAGYRGTGAYSVVLELTAGDWIQTFAHSDGWPWPTGGKTRHLMEHNFSGFLIAD